MIVYVFVNRHAVFVPTEPPQMSHAHQRVRAGWGRTVAWKVACGERTKGMKQAFIVPRRTVTAYCTSRNWVGVRVAVRVGAHVGFQVGFHLGFQVRVGVGI